MRVTWITDDKHAPSTVEYGMQPGTYNAMATGDHTSYRYFFYSSGKIHHVKIGPLEPATTYYYRCGGSGPELSFKTPPATLPLEFVVIGERFARLFHDHILITMPIIFDIISNESIVTVTKVNFGSIGHAGN